MARVGMMGETTAVPITDFTNISSEEVKLRFTEALDALPPHNDSVQTHNASIYSRRYGPTLLRQRFSAIDRIFSDADGTILSEGLRAIPGNYIQLLRELAGRAVRTTIITGKPLAEVAPLFAAAGTDAPFDVMCEKGAYIASAGGNGSIRIEHLLSSAVLEKEVLDARDAWEAHITAIPSEQRPYYFGRSGSGQHRSIISIDIFAAQPPADYLSMVGQSRDAIKLKDAALLAMAETEIEEFFQALKPEWRIVHLGNANTDITPHLIEKDIALEASASFQQASGVLVLGDTNNDRAMFNLTKRHGNVTAGQVLYRASALGLVEASDAVTIGMANCMPYLLLLLETHPQ